MIRLLPIMLCSMTAFANIVPESKTEKEVRAATETWRQAMVVRDRATLEKIFAPGLIYTHSNGKTENKTEAIEAVVNGKDRIESIEITDANVTVYGKTALVKAKLSMRVNSGNAMNILNLDVLFVWVRDGSRWQMVARQAVRL